MARDLAKEAAALVLQHAEAGEIVLTPEEQAAISALNDTHHTPIIRLARLAASGRMRRADVEAAFNQTRLMGRGVSRIILEMLLQKATLGDACPYDAKTLQFLAKGFGIVSPSKPVDDATREQQVASAAKINAMSNEELADDILNSVRQTQEQGRADEAEARRLKKENS